MKRVTHSAAMNLLNSLKFDLEKPYPVAAPLPNDVDLKQCPFCGGDELCLFVSHDGNSAQGCQVSCEYCGYAGNLFTDPESAMEDWNEEVS
ncbi:MAG TPA: Lar family restriction alleviation protein [Pseudomonadales bacterium]|nr:Lar family restriction alleviation protein [Pseudomonadales bacterium]